MGPSSIWRKTGRCCMLLVRKALYDIYLYSGKTQLWEAPVMACICRPHSNHFRKHNGCKVTKTNA